ncbi:CPCC family cysteine-rich protein [Anaerotignum sp.]|uniref:CPCC family cysteine-rich protein n=1 Tax=Anaerotignum sp. TaxID=2039241 RepID=UPI0028A80981|nr:CPCC family cysteine-rich protein [Anaerotignum sp.]
MREEKYEFLPTIMNHPVEDRQDRTAENEVFADAPCPCCGYITVPNHGDALAYICPVCLWEVDLFIKSDKEPSDQNHGLTLEQGRKNFERFGAVLSPLRKYCREPRVEEMPR